MNRITTAATVAVLVAGGAVAVSTMTADAESSALYGCDIGVDLSVILGDPQTVEGDAGAPVDYQIDVQGLTVTDDFPIESAVAHTQNGTVELMGDGAGNGSAIAGVVSEQVETIERIEITHDGGQPSSCTPYNSPPQPTVIIHPIIPPVPPTTVPPGPGPGPGPGPAPGPQPLVPGERAEAVVGQPRYAG